MDIATKQVLESEGFKVIEGHFDFYYKTSTFVKLPNGIMLPQYDRLHEIPILNDGDEFLLTSRALPEEARINDVRAGLHQIPPGSQVSNFIKQPDGSYIAEVEHNVGQLWLVGIVLLIVLSSVIFWGIYSLIQKWAAPCGTEDRVEEISECVKLVIKPNCQARTFNSCTNEWIAGDDWSEPPSFFPDIPDWAFGVLAVAAGLVGIYIFAKYGIPVLSKALPKIRPKITAGVVT